MPILNKFKKISQEVKEYLFLNRIKLKDSDLDINKEIKIKQRFGYYKAKKDFIEMDKTIDLLQESIKDPMFLYRYKQELVYLAAKENKELAYDYITKYKLEFNKYTLYSIIKDDNIPVLELFMINPAVKFEGNYKDLIGPENIVREACYEKKMNFLRFACDFPNQDSSFYENAITIALIIDYPEAIQFIATEYKEKIPQEVFANLTKVALEKGRLHMAEYLKDMSNDKNLVLPNDPVEQKIKQLREEKFGKNTNNELKK